MRIGEFSRKSGIPVDTLRYYDQIGLLQPEKEGKYRIYSEDDLRKVQAIVKLKKLNFSLDEIREILQLDAALDAGLEQGVRNLDMAYLGLQMLEKKYEEVVQLEKEITEAKGQLNHFIGKLEQFIKGGNLDE